ncbi:MAG: hypothetical protein QOD06_580 [Candidatus Binatota bacterium]|jgi:hypothetical protein|nr:hypothetical protein [Candidatus Binatota bacterium]
MQDRPDARELLEAVEQFLERDVVPVLEGPKQFHARVAANVMRILAREARLGDGFLRAELRRLGALLHRTDAVPETGDDVAAAVREATEQLCRRIRAGDADAGAWRDDVLAHVRRTVEEKLEIANPRMLPQGRRFGQE